MGVAEATDPHRLRLITRPGLRPLPSQRPVPTPTISRVTCARLKCLSTATLCRQQPRVKERRGSTSISAAVQHGTTAVERLIELLEDIPTPAGPTPNQLAESGDLIHLNQLLQARPAGRLLRAVTMTAHDNCANDGPRACVCQAGYEWRWTQHV